MSKKFTHWFPLSLFNDVKTTKKFQCAVCNYVPAPEFASTHTKCGGIFCHSCIISWIFAGNSCPVCEEVFTPELIIEKNKVLFEEYGKLVMKCPWHKHCEWKGEISKINDHKKTKEKYIITVEKVVSKKITKRVPLRRLSNPISLIPQ